jgi:hypothetical protein
LIAHEHGDVKFAHYPLNLYRADSNHTIGSFASFLRDLEKPPAYSLRFLFENMGLCEAMLVGKDVLAFVTRAAQCIRDCQEIAPHIAFPIGQLCQRQ